MTQDLERCAAEVRECADKQASDQTRARLIQIADRIEAALRGDEPPAKPKPIVVKPETVSGKAAAKAAGE